MCGSRRVFPGISGARLGLQTRRIGGVSHRHAGEFDRVWGLTDKPRRGVARTAPRAGGGRRNAPGTTRTSPGACSPVPPLPCRPALFSSAMHALLKCSVQSPRAVAEPSTSVFSGLTFVPWSRFQSACSRFKDQEIFSLRRRKSFVRISLFPKLFPFLLVFML